MDEINCKVITDFSNNFHKDKQNRLAQNAVRRAKNLTSVLMDAYKARDYNEVFTNAIHVDVRATNQETSGRCWLFAVLNVIRLNMIQNYKLDKEFELSLLKKIQKLKEKENKTIIMVTHNITPLSISDEIIILKDGRINEKLNYSSFKKKYDFLI